MSDTFIRITWQQGGKRPRRGERRRVSVVTLVLAVLALGVLVAPATSAHPQAEPSEGTVSLEQRTLSWQGEHYAVGSALFPGITCQVPTVCDRFDLTVAVDPSHWDDNTGGVEIVIAWEDASDDFDLHVFDGDGNPVGSSIGDNPSTGVPMENVFVDKASGPYDILVNPFSVTDSDYTGHVALDSTKRSGKPAVGGEVPSEPLLDVPCEDRVAGPFPCKNIDLGAYLPLSAIGGANRGNDIWGWTDPGTGREYALMGTTRGTSFVDVTEPTNPTYLGELPSHQPVRTVFRQWSDIKVYADHAFVVSEEPLHGMQVFDLTRLRGVTEPQTWNADAHYGLFGGAHNIAVNEDSGFAYAIGTLTCDGGPHVIDIRQPTLPVFAGCVAEDGYTHDTQAVTYTGPDTRFTGREILFNSNEDTVTIVDVTDKLNPVQLSRTPYENASYTHQGWLTEDSRHFLFNDELDEQNHGLNTTTYILDVTSLTEPVVHGTYVHGTPAIDHNLYVKGNRLYEANYRAGLRILDTKPIDRGTLREVGYFDIYPADDQAQFNGAWSNYPFFDSGTVIVSGIEQGLFVLRPTGRAL